MATGSGTPAIPTEICDRVDNDCNAIVGDAAVPSGSASLQLISNTQITWGALPGATAYDRVSGSVSRPHSTGGDFTISTGTCMANDTPARSASDFRTPQAGNGFWYLVRGVNCGGDGTYDTGGASQVGLRDPEIAASGAHCP